MSYIRIIKSFCKLMDFDLPDISEESAEEICFHFKRMIIRRSDQKIIAKFPDLQSPNRRWVFQTKSQIYAHGNYFINVKEDGVKVVYHKTFKREPHRAKPVETKDCGCPAEIVMWEGIMDEFYSLDVERDGMPTEEYKEMLPRTLSVRKKKGVFRLSAGMEAYGCMAQKKTGKGIYVPTEWLYKSMRILNAFNQIAVKKSCVDKAVWFGNEWFGVLIPIIT